VSTPDSGVSGGNVFDVGIAVLPLQGSIPAQRTNDASPDGQVPGFDEAIGRRHSAVKPPFVIRVGAAAVEAATEAIAAQVGLASRRIAASLGDQLAAAPVPGPFDLDSVTVTFGITLTAGVQTLFTAQGESSAQVTVTLTARRDQPAGHTPAASAS
jgi:hypothetical protein